MPLYEYRCEACGQHVEVIQRFSDPAPEACRACGKGPLTRLLSSPAIQFKGSGWYVTDYARKSDSGQGGKPGAAGAAGAEGSGDSAKTDSAAKTESVAAPAPAKAADTKD